MSASAVEHCNIQNAHVCSECRLLWSWAPQHRLALPGTPHSLYCDSDSLSMLTTQKPFLLSCFHDPCSQLPEAVLQGEGAKITWKELLLPGWVTGDRQVPGAWSLGLWETASQKSKVDHIWDSALRLSSNFHMHSIGIHKHLHTQTHALAH